MKTTEIFLHTYLECRAQNNPTEVFFISAVGELPYGQMFIV
jgi:hypothetical protein